MIQAILKKIDQSRRFLVASHENPDGDALASTLALYHGLRERGKEVVAFNVDGVPDSFRFLPGSEAVVDSLHGFFDVGFILDAGELRRAGSGIQTACRSLINIDHHPHSEFFGEINYVDEKASATGALIYRLLKASGREISFASAICIYAAILSDTGSFRYSNADPEAFRIASEMVERGVKTWDVAAGLYESQGIERLRLLSRVLETLTVSDCRRFAAITISGKMMRDTGARPEDTDGFINYPRSIREVEVAVSLRELEDKRFKISFRSKGAVDVGDLARNLGGGGHHNAAGAVMEGTSVNICNQLFKRLEELLTKKQWTES